MGIFFKRFWGVIVGLSVVITIISAKDIFRKKENLSVPSMYQQAVTIPTNAPIQINIINNNEQDFADSHINALPEIEPLLENNDSINKTEIEKEKLWKEITLTLEDVDRLCSSPFRGEEKRRAIKKAQRLRDKIEHKAEYRENLTTHQMHIWQQITDSQSINIGSCIQ